MLVLFSATIGFSQGFAAEKTEYTPEYIASKMAEYAVNSSKDGSSVPDHIYYSFIFGDFVLGGTAKAFSSLDLDVVKRMDSPNNSRFVNIVWSGMNEVCESVRKDGGEENIIANAWKMDAIATAYDDALNEYYGEVIKTLTGPAQADVKSEAEHMKSSESVGYSSVRIGELTQEDPFLGKQLIFDGCGRFSTIDVDAILEKNHDLKLGSEEMKLIEMKSQE